MAITAKSVYRDTGNFFRNQFVTILLLSVLCAFIATVLLQAMSPTQENIKLLLESMQNSKPASILSIAQKLTPEQQKVLLQYALASNLSLLINSVIFTASMLLMIQQVSAGQRISALHALGASVLFLPRLFILLFLVILLVQAGIVFFVLPGLLLTVLLALSPVILVQDKTGVFHAIAASTRLALRNTWLLTPAILLWILARASLMLFIPSFVSNGQVASLMMNIAGNLLSGVLLIYLFRLYTLIR